MTILTPILACMVLTSPAIAGDLAFVTSQNAGMVSIVDLTTHEIVSETPIEGQPAAVAYDAAHGRAFVVSANTGMLWVLGEDGRIITSTHLGSGTFAVATGPDGAVYVTNWDGARLIRLEEETLRQVWNVPTGATPAGVAVSPDGTFVATADRDDNRVSLFDTATGRMLHSVATGQHPFGLTFHANRLWIADVMSDTVSVVDPAAGRVVGTIPTGSRPYGVGFAGGRGFVTNQYDGTVTVFDPLSLTVQDEIETGDYPEGVAALPDGSGVVVANWDSDLLTIIDAASLVVTAQIDMPSGPRAFGQFTGRQVKDLPVRP